MTTRPNAEAVGWLALWRCHGRLRQSLLLLAMAFSLLTGGLWMHELAQRQRRAPAELQAARQALDGMGGAAGLEARRERLLEIRRALLERQRAAASDSAAYSRRVDELFAELGIEISAASDWQAVPEAVPAPAALFVRHYRGSGTPSDLWTALHSLESWADQARVRALEVTPRGAGRVDFTAQLAVVRRPQQAPDSAGAPAATAGAP